MMNLISAGRLYRAAKMGMSILMDARSDSTISILNYEVHTGYEFMNRFLSFLYVDQLSCGVVGSVTHELLKESSPL